MFRGEVSFFWWTAFAAFAGFSIFRSFYWWRNRNRFGEFSLRHKKKDLRSVTLMGPLLAGFFSGLAAYQFYATGDLEQAFLGLTIVLLSTAGAFSLYVLPMAAMTTIFFGIMPLAAVFVLSGNDRLISLGVLLFSAVVFSQFMLWKNFRSFYDTVDSRLKLEGEKIASLRTAASVERLAYHDALTDLPNRRKFIQLVSEYQQNTENGAVGFAVGVIDIIGFKSIDDAYGRVAGDTLLRQVADRLLTTVDKLVAEKNTSAGDVKGVVARLGGDQFVFILPGIENVVQALEFGQAMCQPFKEDFELPEASVSLSFSCGFALFPYSDSSPDRLIARADLARKMAVSNVGEGLGVFDLELESAHLREARVRQALAVALNEGAIEPWFQPIVRIENGEIIGFEALARWHDSKLGQVAPDEFIEIAEQSQLIEQLTLDLFARSLQIAKTWQPGTKLFYNLSAKLLTRQQSVEKMLDILKNSGFPACRLDIELTETAVMGDLELAKLQMQKFKQAGVGIALDDFGSGYSSLGQIRDLPLDKVKIDKSFTDQVCTDKKIAGIVGAIVQLCKQLEISCVVEGIEDIEQLGVLSDMGVEYGQGYLFSRPIPAEKTVRRLQMVNAA